MINIDFILFVERKVYLLKVYMKKFYLKWKYNILIILYMLLLRLFVLLSEDFIVCGGLKVY